VRTGKVELGQGIKTAIAMIAAEELTVPVSRITVKTGSTSAGPNEFITAGSMSIEGSGSAVRQACAEVRSHLLGLAAARFGVDAADLIVEDSMIKHPATNETATYIELMQGQSLDIAATGEALPRPFATYKTVGKTATRVDLLAKITGAPAYVQDLRDPDTLHARVVRPPSMAYTLEQIDKTGVEQMQGVIAVIVDGSFVAVVAEDEYTASIARSKLGQAIIWRPAQDKRLPGDIHEYLESNPGVSLLVEQGTPTESPIPPRNTEGKTLTATYRKPYHMHGSIGPSAATARWEGNKLYIRSHSQGPYVIRGALAAALGIPPEDIVVEHAENAGCYGHNGADDAAMDAAMVARAVPGKTVLLKWEREDEHAWEPYSPAMVMRMQASLKDGKVTHWNADIYSQSHSGRPVPHRSVSNLIAAWHKSNPMKRAEARPGMGNHSGIHRNADPIYEFPDRRIIKHLVTDQRVRTSSTRGLGAFGNVFAIESFMDELAHAAGTDPVEFRLAHLSEPRAVNVIKTAWQAARARNPSIPDGWQHGRGFAFARYKNRQTLAAVVIDLLVNETTLAIKLDHGIIAADSGQIIDRDGLANQLEGGLIQAASWTLKEAVQFDEFATASLDWETYPILRFDEVPTVDVHLLDHPELPSLGAGEATQGPTPAAISNAIFSATGIRLRNIPFTSDTLRAAALADQEDI
jgi:CO/xanthine dehydrogenase Mo-binding subunit